jgi:hypothetical protein
MCVCIVEAMNQLSRVATSPRPPDDPCPTQTSGEGWIDRSSACDRLESSKFFVKPGLVQGVKRKSNKVVAATCYAESSVVRRPVYNSLS